MKLIQLEFCFVFASEEDKEYLEEFNLLYLRKSDKVKFLAKRITSSDYVIINSESGKVTQITRAKLRSGYHPIKALNKKNKKVERLVLKRWGA